MLISNTLPFPLYASQGEIRHINRTFITSYSSMSVLADEMFPVVSGSRPAGPASTRSPDVAASSTESPLPHDASVGRRYGKSLVFRNDMVSLKVYDRI